MGGARRHGNRKARRGRRRRGALLLAGLLAVLLAAGLLGGSLLSPPAAAQLALPAADAPPAGRQGRSWPHVNRARRCGRLWCSAVVFPQDMLNRREITLAIRPRPGGSDQEAALAVEERAETVQVTVKAVIDRVITSLRQEPSESPAEEAAEATAEATARAEGWAFWGFRQRKPLHPLTPTVAVGVQNKATVVFVPANPELRLSQVTLLTVTEPDAAEAGIPVEQLARRWQGLLGQAISQGLWGLEFDQRYPFGRIWLATGVAVVMSLALVILTWIRLVLRRTLRGLSRSRAAQQQETTRELMAAFAETPQRADSGAVVEPAAGGEAGGEAAVAAELPGGETTGKTTGAAAGQAGAAAAAAVPHPPRPVPRSSRSWLSRVSRTATDQPLRLMRRASRLLEPLSIHQLRRQGLSQQLQNLVETGLVISNLLRLSILAGTVGGIVAMFPAHRIAAAVLLRQSLVIPVIWLGLMLARLVAVLWIDHSINNWMIEATLSDPGSRRYALRAGTYSKVLKNVAGVVSVGLAIAATVMVIGIDQSVLTGAGVIAIGLGLLLRNLLQDMMQGLLILLTDRYAIGDVVVIPPHDGFVENMSLFHTQLRGLDGQLTTLPNGTINAVENLTRDWSRVNFEIEVAASEDLRAVLALIRDVAEAMRRDPDWADYFLDPPEVLGVDVLRQSGCLIRVWIKTIPLGQWLVGREFRLRIKEAFDRAGIRLGLPRQEVLLEQRGEAG